jgi:lipopolysaccharide transport system permease protein
MDQSAAPSVPTIVIRRTRGPRFLDLRELWTYRELVYFLTWRNVKVRYKQTAIGVAWALLQPVALMVAFTLFFGELAGIPSEGVPYPIFAFVALLPWQLFSTSISGSANSLVTDQQLITRVYFPRMIVPVATVAAALVDFLIAAVLLVVLMLFYGVTPGASILWTPVFVLVLVVAALGVGFWLSALNVEYRDVQHAIPFINQLWLFLTTVVYPTSLVPDAWQWLYSLNPMTGVVDGFRWAFLGVELGSASGAFTSAVSAVLFFLTGAVWFRYRERTFVDAVGSGGR